MIIRHLTARAGRRALSQHAPKQLTRFFSQADTTSPGSSTRQLDAQTAPPSSTAGPATQSTPSSASIEDSIAAQYHAFKHQQKHTATVGSEIGPHYQPHMLLKDPPTPADVTLELLLAAEAHQGHATSLWNPANARYIYGIRQGVHIISLEVTAAHLRRAAKVVQEVSKRGGLVLFVGTREGQDTAVVRASQLAKAYHLIERWIPGSITNGQQILGKCRTKVVNEFDEEVPGFEDQLLDRPVLKPDLVVCLNPLENYVLLHECALNNIPTIGVIDTNADPTWVTYPIPANDDSLRCIQVIAGVLGRAGEAGQKERLAAAAQGKYTFTSARGLVMPENYEEPVSQDVVNKLEEGLLDDAVDMDETLDQVRNRERSERDLKKID